ncbi:hypothetical protein OOT46_04520 [Aquabacterium sp. A7-Y]|uniref:hypothetical protein n=1 Tax=Aquabacterium sp. A7-Y TaxID=1349605 RepID=UPI00223CBD00|nr:hypothetical protein [Aquabacterium sp. A7-Y]MCW7537116.1 hypothetical protein [Aquabacterium sp. A7-Y]
MLDAAGGTSYVYTPVYYREPEPELPPAPKKPDVQAAADRVMDAGERPIIKDNYEKRLDVFAQEMSQGDAQYQAELIDEILKRDPGAFDSWLKSNRVHDLTGEGLLTTQERDTIFRGMKAGIEGCRFNADEIPANFIRDSKDPALIASYMRRQNTEDRGGFERSLTAFSGVPADQMRSFIADPNNKTLVRDFTLSVQRHQDWYENQTLDLLQTVTTPGGVVSHQHDAPVSFSKEQLAAMRDAFRDNDGLKTNGELLLAYPDRIERNEEVTRQYSQLSHDMADIVGKDNANWATFAVWASDEIGRNLEGGLGIELGEMGLGDPRHWLSVGNSKLISDIGPGFQHFTKVFSDPANRNMSFEDFWAGFEAEWGGRGISYLDGGQDTQLDMKNAFKAYHEAMQLRQQETDLGLKGPGHEQEIAALANRRGQLMLYANTLVGLQEQDIIQPEIEKGMQSGAGLGPVNLWGAGRHWIDLHSPDRTFHTNESFPVSGDRVKLDATFTTVDGKTIRLNDALNDRLAGLRGDDKDPSDPASAATGHWERYGERMTYIYHLFAEYQRDGTLFTDPRVAFDSRATELNNDPHYPYG